MRWCSPTRSGTWRKGEEVARNEERHLLILEEQTGEIGRQDENLQAAASCNTI